MARRRTEEGQRVVRPFADTLRDVNRGELHDELSSALHDLVAAVMKHRKPGKLTFTIKVSPSKNPEVLEIDDTVKVDAPTADRQTTYWYVTPSGNLSLDPRQEDMLPGITVVRDNKEGTTDE